MCSTVWLRNGAWSTTTWLFANATSTGWTCATPTFQHDGQDNAPWKISYDWVRGGQLESMETNVEQLYGHCSTQDETAGVQGRIISSLYRCWHVKDFQRLKNRQCDKNDLAKIIQKFDEFTIWELNETFERYTFNSRNQQENESIDAYVTILRTLTKTYIHYINIHFIFSFQIKITNGTCPRIAFASLGGSC